MKQRQPRVRLVIVALGVFVALVGLAAVLLKIGQPATPEASTPSAAGVVGPADQVQSDAAGAEVQDEAGATAAALAYAAAPQAWLYMTDDEVRAEVAVLATSEAADRLADEVVDEIASARVELADSAGPIWWVVHPVAWRMDSFRPTKATVSVWTFSFLSAADVAVPQTEWTTTTFDLEWVRGGWRVASVRDSVGPTPAVGPTDQPWEPEPLDDALDGFTRLAWGDFS